MAMLLLIAITLCFYQYFLRSLCMPCKFHQAVRLKNNTKPFFFTELCQHKVCLYMILDYHKEWEIRYFVFQIIKLPLAAYIPKIVNDWTLPSLFM